MQTFTCSCGNTLYFENTQCIQCGKALGFDPGRLRLLPLVETNGHWLSDETEPQHYHLCANYAQARVCNWLIPADAEHDFCPACRLNEIIPDLQVEENHQRWYKLEQAKRRLLYTLLCLSLPIVSHEQDQQHGLGFRFMADIQAPDPYSEELITYQQIMTGHSTGTITINIIEADDSAREKIRASMNESYRTLLGHFRHEIGHYYWDLLIARSDDLAEFRRLFGDEHEDYENSLRRYYEQGPEADWYERYISPYASAHPWEDWAESWAHYLHSVDLLETAHHHQLSWSQQQIGDGQMPIGEWLRQEDFGTIIQQMMALTGTLNELNRSLGFADPYPFEHSPQVIEKLAFIHRLILRFNPA